MFAKQTAVGKSSLNNALWVVRGGVSEIDNQSPTNSTTTNNNKQQTTNNKQQTTKQQNNNNEM
jgi:predicted GTPase